MVAETEDDLVEGCSGWRDGVESGGMTVGVNKAKVMIGGKHWRVVREVVGWPCGVCGGGVGDGSMQCAGCLRWVHGGVVVWQVACTK